MPYSTIEEIKDDITAKITSNNVKDITGAELRTILLGMCDFVGPALTQQLAVNLGSGNSVGGTQNGEIFAIGTSLENVLRDILIKTIHPTYVAPTLVLSSDISTLAYEAGTTISPALNIVFTQNDAGSIVTRSLKRNATQIATSFPHTDSNILIPEGNVAYQATVNYGQGPVKNNNLGVPDPIGQIAAGAINSNTITYVGQRKAFYGTPASTPTTSANVRALSGNALNAQVGMEFTINIPIGATRVVFAYPSSLQDVSSVKYLEMSGSEIKSLFTKTTFNVEGANAYTAVGYKIFTYVPVEPFTTTATYKVTI